MLGNVINHEKNMDHGVDNLDVIFVNHDCSNKEGNDFINSLEGTDVYSGKIRVIHRPWDDGGGVSMASFDYAFKKFPNSHMAFNRFFEDMAVRVIRGRLGFNISIRNDLNMRFFEIMSSGSCLLTNTTVEGIEDLGFEDGKHFLGFDSKESLVEQALWGIENPASRERIAREGHNMVRKFHTYDLRMQRILDDFGVKLAA